MLHKNTLKISSISRIKIFSLNQLYLLYWFNLIKFSIYHPTNKANKLFNACAKMG